MRTQPPQVKKSAYDFAELKSKEYGKLLKQMDIVYDTFIEQGEGIDYNLLDDDIYDVMSNTEMALVRLSDLIQKKIEKCFEFEREDYE